MNSTLYLIDASPYIFRGFFSIPSKIKTPAGEPANAIYGYTEFLIQFLKKTVPTHLAVAFDGSLTTSFRNEIYPAYKAQRELPPPELEEQIGRCIQVTQAMGMQTFIDDKFEADDLIGTLVTLFSEQFEKVVILSSDKDFSQFVNAKTSLWDFARDIVYDEKAVQQKFGVRPDQIVDYIALMGDAVDNIPGIPGIGSKSASILLNEFGSLDNIYNKIGEIEKLNVRGAKSLKAKIVEGHDKALLSRKLAEIKLDIPLKVTLETLKCSGVNKVEIDSLFEEFGFTQIRSRVPESSA